jgi:transposase
MEVTRNDTIHQIIHELLSAGKTLPEEKARALAKMLLAEGEEAVTFLLLEIAMRVKESKQSPSTPSGMIPPYEKESVQTNQKKRKKKAGGKPGHRGSHRSPPDKIDHQEVHRLNRCPDCGGSLQRCNGEQSTRSRFIEDIPCDIQPEVTEYIIHRDYCPHCRKHVEPKIETALPRAAIGNRLLCLTAYWHYALGMTISQIRDTLNFHLHFKLSKGGLIQKWHQLRLILLIWYEALAEEIQNSAVLHADETGWRVNGKTHWLWCFTNDHTTLYMVDRSRGSPALKRFFKEAFEGVLVTDFGGSRHFVLGGLRRHCVWRTTVLFGAFLSRIGKGKHSQFVGGMEGVF